MEKSPISGADLRPLGKPSVRRRLIQSTLLPHKSQDMAAKEDQEFMPGEIQEDDQEEYCGSQAKKSRKRKPKAGIQSQSSRKVTVNAKETQKKKMDEEDSPATVKADFFVKVSERRYPKRQQKEQEPLYSSDNNEKTCSPADITANTSESLWGLLLEAPSPSGQRLKDAKSPPIKRRTNSTPRKKRMSTTPKKNVDGTPNKACCGSLLADPCNAQGEHIYQPIPDLRLEAKLTAEENSRIFAGKQVHPFFSSWKMAKKNLETIDLENNWGSVERRGNRISFSPVHVFERVQDEAFTLDWGNWIFSDRSFVSSSWNLESVCSSINERSVNALDFVNFLDITSFCQNEGSSNQFPIQLEKDSLDYSPLQRDSFPALTCKRLGDEHVTYCAQQGGNEMGHGIGKVECFSEKAKFVQKLDDKWHGIYLQERMTSYYHDCDGQPENSLWTIKYQPEKAMEICGNGEAVKFLNDWLHLWHIKCSRISTTDDHKQIVHEDDYYPSDSNSEDVDEETTLKNVLLVTGPVGSGKSAAIYACAKEQGFQVIEVNASDWRSGALVKQKFGEAVESHWLKCSMQNPEDSDLRTLMKPSSSTYNDKAAQGSDNEIIELISVSDGEDYNNTSTAPRKSFGKEKAIAHDQSQRKTLILFEDVDATLYEDRGFIATIQQLAETAKRPMILTSNSDSPILPNNLDRLEISFRKPSPKEILSLVYMVCALEKAQIGPSLVDRFVDNCQADVRKTITHLQFWCQGESHRKDSGVPKRYAPMMFDLDAWHHILPHIVPCGYPSLLSEVIEKEISKSLMEEKNVTLTGIVEEEEQKYSDPRVYNNEPDVEFSVQCGNTSELSSSLGSPVAFGRRNVKKRHDMIMSSDSEEDRSPGNVFEHMSNEVPECTSNSPSHYPNESSFHPMTEQLLWEGEKFQKYSHHSVTPDYSHVSDTCNSFDKSCVPESTFVPETEIFSRTSLFSGALSTGNADGVGEAFESIIIVPKFMVPEFNDRDNSLAGKDQVSEITIRNFDLNEEPIHGEAMGDSQIEHVEALPRASEIMDECSRMDFSRKSESMQKPLSLSRADSVQEIWRKLRHGHIDLQQYISHEEKDASQVLEFAYKMSNLISEADLLLSDCQSLIHDYLEPPLVPLDKSHSFSWYDDQLQIASTIVQHGICSYAKQAAAVGLTVSRVDLARELLASSTNTMALGKLTSLDTSMIRSSEKRPLCCARPSKRELESSLCSVVQCLVPTKSCLTLKGNVFHEYLSSLAQISRSESSRLLESTNNSRQKRGRASRNYLSTGALGLSPEDISLLGQYGSYEKVSDQPIDES